LGIEPFDESQVGPSSIDLHLGTTLVKYTESVIELGKSSPLFNEISIDPEKGYVLKPNELVLGCTMERVRMPNGYQGFVETKGDIARAGIQVHNMNGHVDPGSDHIITLEISNNNSIPIVLYPRIRFCQLYVHTLSGQCEKLYHGKYFGQTKPSTYKLG
jgi:dCTP deaminase